MMRLHSVIIAAVVLAASMVIAEDNLDESNTIDKIQLLGGAVTRDETVPGSPVTGVSFASSKRFNEKHLHLLKAFKSLTTLDLLDTPMTDVGLKEISELTNLTTLQICGPEITDDGLVMLAELKSLVKLTLVGSTDSTWNGLTDLRESLPKLKVIKRTRTNQYVQIKLRREAEPVVPAAKKE